MAKKLLEEYAPVLLSLEESSDGRHKIARGEFGRCGVPTSNGRVYSRDLMEREISSLQSKIKSGALYGELDHPSDGKTKLERACCIITNLNVEDDGRVVGEARIMNTPRGQILQAIIEAGGQVGVSSRGFGSTASRQDGNEDVGTDFRLKTYDFVADPAMATAIPMIESVEEEFELTPEVLRDEYPALYKQVEDSILSEEDEAKLRRRAEEMVSELLQAREDNVRSEMREQFERSITDSLTHVREQVSEEIRGQFAEDPEIGGAKTVLGQIYAMVAPFAGDRDEAAAQDSIRAKDLEISKLREELEQATVLAKKSAYSLYVERQIAGHPMSKTIRSLMSDAHKLESLDSVKERLSAILADVGSVVEMQEASKESDRDLEITRLQEENEGLLEQINDLQDQIDAAVQEVRAAKDRGKQSALALVEAERRAERAEREVEEARESGKSAQDMAQRMRRAAIAVGAPGKRLTQLAEADGEDLEESVSASLGSREADLDEVRNRVRRGYRYGGLSEEASTPMSNKSTIFGVDMAEIQRLAGITK